MRLKDQAKASQHDIEEKKFKLEKDLMDLSKARIDVENELRLLEDQHGRAATENHKNKMKLEKDEKHEENRRRRHETRQNLHNELIEKKRAEIEELDAALEDANNTFLAMSDLQESLAEAEDLRTKIEEAKVQISLLQI